MSARPVHIRPPDGDETTLSAEERLIAIREGVHPVKTPRWHPALMRNWSVVSAGMHRQAAVDEIAEVSL